MRIRRRHVLHSAVSIVVLVQLGFAAAFSVDAAQANGTYDALAAHHVVLQGRVGGCASVTGGMFNGTIARACRVHYRYGKTSFSALIPVGQSTAYYLDPTNTSIRMREVNFKGRDSHVGVDIALAGALLVGALAVTTAHLWNLHRTRTSRDHGTVTSLSQRISR
jgi:hypothetical protein